MTRPSHVLLATFAFLIAPLQASAEARIELDASSFFHIPSLGITANLPVGAVPIRATPITAKRWAISVSKADLVVPDQVLPSGDLLVVSATADLTGECSVTGSSAACTLKFPLLVQAGAYPPRLMMLSFTTGTATKKTGGLVATRSGSALSTSTGSVQLVAVGETPPESALTASQPFYVVLSGTLKDSPLTKR